jgi:altronate hydrolase
MPPLSSPTSAVPAHDVTLLLHPQDDIVVAKSSLPRGMVLALDPMDAPISHIPVLQPIPTGHKLAVREIAAGNGVRRYGQIIGFASQTILPGEHVHDHNVHVGDRATEYDFCVEAKPVVAVPGGSRRTFLGYGRKVGRAGTRNYVAVISTVTCSAHAAREIARCFTPERLADYPNVDGVIALAGTASCSMQVGGPEYVLLQRTQAGMAHHPNVGAAILVGLGCETNQITALMENYGLGGDVALRTLVIQEIGGVQKTVQAGVAMIEELLPVLNSVERTPQPISELVLALQCGGSDTWSGVTANPLAGLLGDEVVRQGGTIVLAETPEIFGAEHLLARRATNPEVGQRLLDLVRWWEERARRLGLEINNNPTPGNKAGGLSTIYEKALGAVAKSGHTPLTAVYDYAEPVSAWGCTFMNTPGFDPVAVTGQVAGGCNLVLFTTGRGSVFGFKPAPCIKIASNSSLYDRMSDDMDFDAGRILAGANMEGEATNLLELVVAVASGQPSKSEAQGIGEAEYSPWGLGETL